MKQFRKTLCMLLALCLLLGALPAGAIRASAAEPELGLRPLDGAYQPMGVSQNMVDMIKVMEGFSPEPYWDHSQWTIGYGTSCGTDPDNKPDITMTEPEAEAELIRVLNEKYGVSVNDFCEDLGKQPSQQQFDALVDFTYNVGGGWMSGCRLSRWLENPTTALELVDAMGAWCRAGGEIAYQLAARRVRDALIFLHGEYYLMKAPVDFESDLPVVSNSDLPRYKFVRFLGNGGQFGSSDDEIQYYEANAPMASFPIPEKDGREPTGWQVIAESNHQLDTPWGIAPGDRLGEQNLEVEALWNGENPAPPEPAPTDPEPTDPVPPEPEPTDPEPQKPENPFRDVPEDAYYRDAVVWAVENGITKGLTDTKFGPEKSGTRAQAVTFLWRAAGCPQPGQTELSFRDVPENAYYRDAVAWAVENGITRGRSETEFGAEEECLREQIVTFLWRMEGSPRPESGENPFTDVHEGDYFHDAVLWAVENGITVGKSANTFGPELAVTRAQIVTFLYRDLAD